MNLSVIQRLFLLFFFVALVCTTIGIVGKLRSLLHVVTDEEMVIDVSNVELYVQERFKEHVEKYNRHYDAVEYLKRLRYFEASLKEIDRLNALDDSAVFGVNKFSDLSREERINLSMTTVHKCRKFNKNCNTRVVHESGNKITDLDEDIPLKVDWRKGIDGKEVVGPILNQKMCRGCWAFSIVGVMESMWAIQGNKFYSLSAQELVDCPSTTGKCSGGDVGDALNFLCTLDYPIVEEKAYPLMLIDQVCRGSRTANGRKIAEYTIDCNVNETEILKQVAKQGPVVAAVNSDIWYFYTGGVITKSCANDENLMVHVVQIVGYDLTAEIPYYILRNNWGEDFGENGYIRIAINKNMCGIANYIAYFTVK